jgi:magnesium-transporting ATPase (P-type)
MATGDGTTTAKAVAGKLGISEVYGEVKPQDKLALVERFQAEGKIVGMAGDGINDAPALAKANVGIAMGTGTDVAINSAHVTLVKGDLRAIARARGLSVETVRNMRQNLSFAFLYNALGIPLAAGLLYPFTGQLVSPMLAAAMSLSSVSVIANALRLRGAEAKRQLEKVVKTLIAFFLGRASVLADERAIRHSGFHGPPALLVVLLVRSLLSVTAGLPSHFLAPHRPGWPATAR